MSEDDTILERDYTAGLACVTGDPAWQRRESNAARGVRYEPGLEVFAQAQREHPAVAAWRHCSYQWRDRAHMWQQSAIFWRSTSAGLALGIVLGLIAWELWS